MTGEEFARYRVQAQLSVRKAADQLHVAPSTIWRWEQDRAAIPASAADEIRRRGATTAEQMSPADSLAYRLGRVWAELERVTGITDPLMAAKASESPARTYPLLLKRAGSGSDRLVTLMAEIPADGFPKSWPEERQAQWWLGYYHEQGDRRVPDTDAE